MGALDSSKAVSFLAYGPCCELQQVPGLHLGLLMVQPAYVQVVSLQVTKHSTRFIPALLFISDTRFKGHLLSQVKLGHLFVSNMGHKRWYY